MQACAAAEKISLQTLCRLGSHQKHTRHGRICMDDAWNFSLLMHRLCATCFHTAQNSCHQDGFGASKLLSTHIQLAQDLSKIGNAQHQPESGRA